MGDDVTDMDGETERFQTSMKGYQEMLLQMDKRNRSVQFKKIYQKHNFDLSELGDEACAKITEKMLVKGGQTSILLDSREGEDADEMRGRMRKLANNLGRIEDETGQQTGYVGFPFLQGHADEDFFIRGPLALFPASMEQKRQPRGGGWYLNFPDSRPIFNGAMIATIKKRAGTRIPDDIEEKFDDIIDELEEFDGPDAEGYFARRIAEWAAEFVRLDGPPADPGTKPIPKMTAAEIGEMPRQKFHITNHKVLGSFPQADNEIYRDYTVLMDTEHQLDLGPLGDLLDVHGPGEERGDAEQIDLDRTRDAELNTVLESDSSQDEVILESKRTPLVLVRGPPGTGKSQVITNLITDALSNGQKVLVVCQKRAALDVVHQRLGEIGLDRFAVVLDKEHSDRKKMYAQLYSIIQDPGDYESGVTMPLERISAQIDQRIAALSGLGAALHKEYFGGATAQKLYSVSSGSYGPVLDLAGAGLDVDWNGLDGYIKALRELEPMFKKFEAGHPWAGRSDFSGLGMADRSRISGTLGDLKAMIPGSALAPTEKAQAALLGHLDTYLNNPGFLKRRRKHAAKEIAGMLGASVDEGYVERTLPLAKRGAEFWEKMRYILDLFGGEGRAALESRGQAGFPDALEALDKSLADFEEMRVYDMKKNAAGSMMGVLRMCSGRLDSSDDWPDTVRKEVHSMWIDVIERENPVLKEDPAAIYERNRSELIGLFGAKREALENRIRARIAGAATSQDLKARRGTPELEAWKAFAKELKRKRKTKPVRQLFGMYAANFFEIAPCWLASPESVSKVFPLRRNLFDLVIVDEASQLSIERALPFLYRARRVVIAGDEKQLQPFDLFQMRDDEEDEEFDEAASEKSLLNAARLRHEPVQLAWHYRSRYQDLINFSNHAFYGGMLQVAPNATSDPRHPPIRWIRCSGAWVKRRNHAEAKEVLEEMARIWKKHAGGRIPSIGVITFNDEQRDLIREQYDKLLDTDADFYRLYTRATEGRGIDDRPFFKNIENVQGDERDIIIFSIGYAKDMDGKFSNRFGTLGMAGGENRLNVAITRARAEMVIVCSIDPGEIKETGRHPGPRMLRWFLEYSKATSDSHAEGVRDALQKANRDMQVTDDRSYGTESPFEAQVLRRLEDRGYKLHTQVGFSGYRIDLGVVHPDDPNRYVLGLECDGATFHSARSARERDIVRQRFLEGKGWRIERIWSRNWWRDPASETDRIAKKIDEAAALSPVSPVDVPSDPGIEPTPNDPGIEPTSNDPGIVQTPNDPGIKPTPDDPGIVQTSNDPGIKPTPDDPGIEPTPNDPGIKPTPDDPGITKERAQQELAELPGRMSRGEITRAEYDKRRGELEKILFG